MQRLYRIFSSFLIAALVLVGVGCDSSPGVDSTPEGAVVEFASSGTGAVPADGTVEIPVEISNPQGEEVTVEVFFAEGSSSAGPEAVGNFDTETITFSANAEPGHTEFVEVDISEADITEGAIAAEFALQQATPQTTQIGDTRTFTLNIGPLDVADVRASDDGTVVTTGGIVTRSYGRQFRFQDETAGMNVFDPEWADELEPGDEIIITAERETYNGLVQLGNVADVSVLSSDNDLPEPADVNVDDINTGDDTYESQLIRLEGVEFEESGTFENYGEYTLTDDTGSITVFLNSADTEVVGRSIPDGTFTYEGVHGHYQGNNQLIPVYYSDFVGVDDNGGDPSGPQEVTIAEAREMQGVDVIVEGIVTRIAGSDARVQDETGGLVVARSANNFAAEAQVGDLVRIEGSTSEYNQLIQIDDNNGNGNLTEWEVLSSGNSLPEPVELNSLAEVGEEHESQLVRVEGLSVVDTDDETFAAGGGAGNYTAEDESGNTIILRLDDGSEYEGEPIPEGTFTFEGAVGQFHYEEPDAGYQLMLIEEGDMIVDNE